MSSATKSRESRLTQHEHIPTTSKILVGIKLTTIPEEFQPQYKLTFAATIVRNINGGLGLDWFGFGLNSDTEL